MRKLICILAVLLFPLAGCFAQKKHREPVKMGVQLHESDTVKSRKLDQRLFVVKGDLGVGIQFSYLDMTSSDSEFMMLLQSFNAYGSVFSVAPFVSYAIKRNQSLGLRVKYLKADLGVTNADLSLLSDDLTLNLQDIRGHANSIQGILFYRTYIGLDNLGRFGLFNDLSLTYARSKTSFSYKDRDLGSYTISNRLKLGLHPGLEFFMMNNVSTHVSIGIGGVSYTNSKFYKDGAVSGTRNATKARFMLDITDISIGMTIHL